MSKPRYATIKQHLLDQIEQGELIAGTKVASENQLSEQFNVSRMTARRALDELAEAGFLYRTQGLGTFVADGRPMSSMLEIRNIVQEIKQRGHHCSIELVRLDEISATSEQAHWLGVDDAAPTVFQSVIVYAENGRAIQYEDRLVNPKLVPDYLQQDFSQTTPHEYLSKVAPLTEADHVVEAVLPDQTIAQYLAISDSTPCLKVSRRTFSRRGIVSIASLFHPGDRYRLGGHLQFDRKS